MLSVTNEGGKSVVSHNVFCDDIKLCGADADSLHGNIKEFYKASGQMYIDPQHICLCSIFGCTSDMLNVVKTDYQMASFSNLYTQIKTGDRSDYAALDFFDVKKSKFIELGATWKELEEVIDTGLYMEYQGEILILSDRFLPYLSRMLNSYSFEKGMNPIRDLYIANQLFEREPFYVTVRQKKNIKKVFYASSTENCASQIEDICIRLVSHMEEKGARILSWEITQEKTEIRFYYPEYSTDGFDFGVTFRMSDIGEYAISLSNSVFVQSEIFFLNDAMLSKKNYGKFDVDEFIAQFEEMTGGLIEKYSNSIKSILPASKLILHKEFAKLQISSIRNKKLEKKIKAAFIEEIEESEGDNKGYAPILKLPQIAIQAGAKKSNLTYLYRALECFILDLVNSNM